MDNQYDQSKVAYENGPKEVNTKRGMPDGKKQFGKGNRMPQDEKVSNKHHVKQIMEKHSRHGRHKEHR